MDVDAPEEDPAVRAAREREQRIAARERQMSAQDASKSMTQDYAAIYGLPSLFAVAPDPSQGTTGPAPYPDPLYDAYRATPAWQRDSWGDDPVQPLDDYSIEQAIINNNAPPGERSRDQRRIQRRDAPDY